MVIQNQFGYDDESRRMILSLISREQEGLVEVARYRRIAYFSMKELFEDLTDFGKTCYSFLPISYSPEAWIKKTLNTFATHKLVSFRRLKKAPSPVIIKCPVCYRERSMRIERIFDEFRDIPQKLKSSVLCKLENYSKEDLAEDFEMSEEKADRLLREATTYLATAHRLSGPAHP